MNGQESTTINSLKKEGIFSLKKFFLSPLIYHLIRVLLGAIFLWSGISKLIDPTQFSVIIDAYGLLPDAWILLVAVVLPFLEMVFGLGLLLDIKGSLAGISALLLLFIVILSYGIGLGLDVDCGCFGPEDPEAIAFHGLWWAFVRDIIMMLSIFYLYYQRINKIVAPKRLRNLFKIIQNQED